MADKKGNEGGFFKFLWNKDTGEVLGRTGTSWFKIIVFYIIFYAGLAAFFGLMLYIFYLTLDIQQPKYQQDASLIGTNPGVGFRPQPDQDANVDSTLIWFRKSDSKETAFWSSQLKEYISKVDKGSAHGIECKEGTDLEKDENKGHSCKIRTDKAALGPCTEVDDFGYKFGAPCVLIKLNRIFGWRPEPMAKSKVPYVDGKLNVPPELKTVLAEKMKQATTPEMEDDIRKSVWFHCEGENPADRENIGHLEYYPSRAINSYYFPFINQQHYKSPFIMVHFQSVTPGVLINIECKAYAANIKPDRPSRTGSVHFEMMVD